MSRRIVTRRLEANAPGATVDTYFDRVIKYIPADIVAAWTAATGIIASQTVIPTEPVSTVTAQDVALWIAFIFGLIVTPLWILRQTTIPGKPPARTQALVATLAFVVWVFALGGPFTTFGFYEPWIGSLVLIGYTLVVGLIIPREQS